MNEKQTPAAASTIRPTKKQRELLSFIAAFISQHGYSPSYREIMAGLHYTSVATVALHVNSLIRRGHLRKRDYSARSLELTQPADAVRVSTNQVAPNEEKWLVDKVEYYISQVEQAGPAVSTAEAIQSLQVLVAALRILGLDAAAQSFQARVKQLQRVEAGQS